MKDSGLILLLLSMTLLADTLAVASPLRSSPHVVMPLHVVMPPSTKRLVMAHYMPWFQAKPYSPSWGWHWTMNHYNPDHQVDGRGEAASHYHPLIGLYDSDDPDALECQAMLMKLSGIDGVIFDWYGTDDYRDYADNNRNTERMIPILRQAGLRFALCYEPSTVPTEVAGGVLPAADIVKHGQRLMAWMQQNFFSAPNYLTLENRPVLLAFGDPYYSNAQWEQIFSSVNPQPQFFTESDRQEPTASVGGFDWPHPVAGTASALAQQDQFLGRAQHWPLYIAAAFPRFDDIYSEAGVGKSYGHIDDDNGQTYATTLTKALQSSAPVVQLVTWNDWGEGTQIEPSTEVGYRDLETTQRLRRKYLDPGFSGTASSLRLPIEWYRLRKKYAGDPVISARLSAFFPLAVAGRMAESRALLARCAGFGR